MIQTYPGNDSGMSIEEVFRHGHPLQIPWDKPTSKRVIAAMAETAGYLAQFPATPSFGGINKLDADRQTLWVASTGIRSPFHLNRDDVVRFDGDTEGGERGIEALEGAKSVSAALK